MSPDPSNNCHPKPIWPDIITAFIINLIIFLSIAQPTLALSFFDNPQCKTFEENIDIRIRDYGARKDLQVRRFQDVKIDINNLLRDLRQDPSNLKKINRDLETIDNLTNQMSKSYTTLKIKLEQAKGLDCQKDKTKIEKFLTEAKNSSNDLKNLSSNIKSLYQNQIKNDLQELQR